MLWKKMTDQEKGQVLLLEVVVLFSFLLSSMMASPLIDAILRVHNCTFRIVFLCFGCVSHNYNWEPVDMEVLLTLGQHETMGALAHVPHPGLSGEEQLETRSLLHDQLQNKPLVLRLLQLVIYYGLKIVSTMMKTTAYKPKSGFPYLWKANSTFVVDVI